MNEGKGELKVAKIRDGVVIDHIPVGKAGKCMSVLGLCKGVMIIGSNLPSGKYEKKDILKLENLFPSENTLNMIALVAPNATINIIRNSETVEKRKVKYPKEITGMIKCINQKCATIGEKYLTSKFTIESVEPLKLRCKYCDKSLNEENVLTQLK